MRADSTRIDEVRAIRRAHGVVDEHAVRLVEDLADLVERVGQLLAQRLGEALGRELALSRSKARAHLVRRGVAADAEHDEVVAVLHLRALGQHALVVDGAVGLAIARRARSGAGACAASARRLAVGRGHQRRHRAHADAAHAGCVSASPTRTAPMATSAQASA